MTRRAVILLGPSQRAHAKRLIDESATGEVMRISKPTRSGQQNDKMWAMLQDVADAKPEGRFWTPETWKSAFMHLLGHQVRFCEGLDGTGPFPLGFRSSALTVQEMADMITTIYEYGDRHGVQWSERGASSETTRTAA